MALAACGSVLLSLALAAPAQATTGGAQPNTTTSAAALPTGGAVVAPAAATAHSAVAPPGVPAAVREAIASANAIVGRPYVWGGGHRSFSSRGYDCSGAVSYLLHGGGLLDSPLDSSAFMHWGERGRGRWITVWTNPGHAFVEVAGLRLDTSAAEDPTGRKLDRIRRDPKIALLYHAREHGFHAGDELVLAQGTARIVEDPDQDYLERVVTPAAAQYLGAPRRGAFWDRWLREYYSDRVPV